jgi:hypothetical protein
VTRAGLRVAGIAVAVVALLGLVGWLLWPSPPEATALRSGTSRYVVSATIDPPRIGSADVTIDLTARDGSASVSADVNVEAVMPLMGFATPALPTAAAGDGRYTVSGVPLMMTGPWELHVAIAGPGGSDDLTLPFTVSG